jgi:hypothetical protein
VSQGQEKTRKAVYWSYLLRLRLVDNAGQPVWRASLEEPGSGHEQHFESLEALCVYLAGLIAPNDDEEKDAAGIP